MNTPRGVKEMHVCHVKSLFELEIFDEIFATVSHNFKMNILRGAVIRVTIDRLFFCECI